LKSKKQNKIGLAFGAHPDDIEIGMGGTIAKLVKLGYEMNLVIASTDSSGTMVAEREAEAIKAAKILGCHAPEFLNLQPGEFMFNRTLVRRLDKIISMHNPDFIFTQWVGDSHQDHQILTRCVLAASRTVNNVLMYETTIPSLITDVPFGPSLYVDISSTIDQKKKAIECHQTQEKRYGNLWIRSIVSRSAYRGFQIRAAHAEVFEVTKLVFW
jgi:LmbE family N-acetylglucosaminyl deacetylase